MEGAPFGRYRLVELLGRGGMGEVWKAFDTATQRVVAVKVLPAQLAADPVFEERFRHEAFAAASLNNPHVVPIHNFGEIEGRLYVDMRLIEGQDLEHVLADGPLDQARAVKIIEQIASALRAAHKIGLVHRDVKPSNILIAEDDFSYLIDFGIARAAGETKLTATGNVVGTWPYMAPERFTTGQSDTRSDIYALTCVLYECLTSSRPFPGNSVEQQIAGHLTTPPPRPSISRPEVTPELDPVIAAGMAKDPDKRYGTTTEMARAARAAITNAAVQTRPAQPGSAPTVAGVAPSAPTRAVRPEQGENAWAPTKAQPAEVDPPTERDVQLPWAPTRAGRPEHVEQASAPTRAQPAEQASAPTRAQPAAQAPTQAQPAQPAPPTEQAQPAWAPTQSGTPEHVQQAWAATALGAPVPHVESASAPAQAYPAEDQRQASPLSSPDIAAPDKWPDDSAPWPWWRRTAVVIPIAVVLIVAAVATILFVISGDEEPAPGGQAGGGSGRHWRQWRVGTRRHVRLRVRRADTAQRSAVRQRVGRRREMGDQIGVPHQGLRGERDEVQRIYKHDNGIGAGRGRRTVGIGHREAGNVPGRRRRGRGLGVAVTGVTAGRGASRRVHRSLDRPQLCQQPPRDSDPYWRRRLRRVGGRSRGDARPGGVARTGAVWQLSGDRHVQGRESQRRREFRHPVVLPSYRRALPELLAEPQRHQGPHLREERVVAGQQVIGFDVHERRLPPIARSRCSIRCLRRRRIRSLCSPDAATTRSPALARSTATSTRRFSARGTNSSTAATPPSRRPSATRRRRSRLLRHRAG